MLHAFEDMARMNPRQLCFTAVDASQHETRFTYHQARLYGSALAQCLRSAGVRHGDFVSVELSNCAAWPLLLLAAAYGNFALVAIDPHLTVSDKAARRSSIEALPNMTISYYVDETNVSELMEQARALIDGEGEVDAASAASRRLSSGRVSVRASLSSGPSRGGYLGTNRDSTKLPPSQLRRYSTDAEETVVHFADHAAHLFDSSKLALVMFTSGSAGKSKPVALTWKNISESARSTVTMVCRQRRGVWQAVLPFYRCAGIQVVVRSFCNKSAFVCYERFDAGVLLDDVSRLGATHISVDNGMLRELLNTDTHGVMRRYMCVLLGGSALDQTIVDEVKQRRLKVYATYGQTETAGQIALGLLDDSFDGCLRVLPGFQVRVVDAGPDGYGKLAVKGPGVCERYLGMRAATTMDGYLYTGDTARMVRDGIVVHERTDDMFVCGATNVFPGEIREKLIACAGVSDAYVFGAADARLGRVPVAFVERNDRGQAGRPTARQLALGLVRSLDRQLARDAVPRFVFPLESFPRTLAGKIDGALLEQCYAERLEVSRVTLHQVKVPLTKPTAVRGRVLTERDSLLIEITDHEGRTGVGECVAFPFEDGAIESLQVAEAYLKKVLIPHVLGQAFLHPGEVTEALRECPEAALHPRSCGALEPAFWDVYGKIAGMPFWQLIGGKAQATSGGCRVRAGAVVEVCGVQETVEAVWRCAEAGYSCVTIDVCPGMAYERIRAVRQVFPDLMITVDAKESFTERNVDELRALDDLRISWIEEPLSFSGLGRVTTRQRLHQLAQLQQTMQTPICLDETIPTLEEAYLALEYRNLKYMVARVGEFGGVRPTLDFIRAAHAQGVHIWMGGMLDLGISRHVHAAFQTLTTVEDAGNTGSVLRHFVADVAVPPHTVERGLVTLNRENAAFGIGCRLDTFTLGKNLIGSTVIE